MCSLACNTALLYSSFVILDISSLGPKRWVCNLIEPAASFGLKLTIIIADIEIKLKHQKLSSFTLIWNVKPRRKQIGEKQNTHVTISCTRDTRVSSRFLPSLRASSAEEYLSNRTQWITYAFWNEPSLRNHMCFLNQSKSNKIENRNTLQGQNSKCG